MVRSGPENEQLRQQLNAAYEYLSVALSASARKSEDQAVSRRFIVKLNELLGAFKNDFMQEMMDRDTLFWPHLMDLQAIVQKSVAAAEAPDSSIELTWGRITDEGDFTLMALQKAVDALNGPVPPESVPLTRVTRSAIVLRIQEKDNFA